MAILLIRPSAATCFALLFLGGMATVVCGFEVFLYGHAVPSSLFGATKMFAGNVFFVFFTVILRAYMQQLATRLDDDPGWAQAKMMVIAVVSVLTYMTVITYERGIPALVPAFDAVQRTIDVRTIVSTLKLLTLLWSAVGCCDFITFLRTTHADTNAKHRVLRISPDDAPWTEKSPISYCLVCKQSERCVVIHPCRHLCVCKGCAESVTAHGRCPLCNEATRRTECVFVS